MKNKFFKHLCVYLCAVMVLLSCVCFPSLGASAYGYVEFPLVVTLALDESIPVFTGFDANGSPKTETFTPSVLPYYVHISDAMEDFVFPLQLNYSSSDDSLKGDLGGIPWLSPLIYVVAYVDDVQYAWCFSSVELANQQLPIFSDDLDPLVLYYGVVTSSEEFTGTLSYFDNEIDGLYPSIEYMLNYYIFGSEHVPTPEQTLVVTFLSVILVLAVIVLPFAIVWFILAKLFSWW